MSRRRRSIFIDGVFEGPAMRLLFQSWWRSTGSANNCTSSTIQCTWSTIQRTSSTIQGILRIIHLKAHTSSSRYILETPEYYVFTFMIIYWNTTHSYMSLLPWKIPLWRIAPTFMFFTQIAYDFREHWWLVVCFPTNISTCVWRSYKLWSLFSKKNRYLIDA